MAWGFRKSKKIAPGLRVSVSKSGVNLTQRVGNTGIYHRTKLVGGKKKSKGTTESGSGKGFWIRIFLAMFFIIGAWGNRATSSAALVAGSIALGVLILSWPLIVWIIAKAKENKEIEENTRYTQTTAMESEASPHTVVQSRSSARVGAERVYTDVRLFHPSSLTAVPDIGDEVRFAEDPENPYDEEAIAARVFMDGEWQTVAFFNRNRLRDMVRDWLRDPSRGEIYAEVTMIEPSNVTVDITFTEG